MKSTKTNGPALVCGPLTRELRRTLDAGAILALDELTSKVHELRLDSAPDRDDVVRMVLSLGLFVLGIDEAGDYGLDELTLALYGKGSDVSMVYQQITDAAHEAETVRVNQQRANRVAYRRQLKGRAA